MDGEPATSVRKVIESGRSELLERPLCSRFRFLTKPAGVPDRSRESDRRSNSTAGSPLKGPPPDPAAKDCADHEHHSTGGQEHDLRQSCLCSFPTAGERTLLLEGDLRRPSLMQIFGTETPGNLRLRERRWAPVSRDLPSRGCGMLDFSRGKVSEQPTGASAVA